MKPSDLPSTEILKASLFGTVCPACGGGKRDRASLCYRCWSSLPRGPRSDLNKFIGHGYEEAMASCLTIIHQATGQRRQFWPQPDRSDEVFPFAKPPQQKGYLR